MAKYTKAELQKLMRKLDFCMMTTVDGRGRLQSRPMSNNKNVDFDGDSWFYSFEDTNKMKHIEKNRNVTLTFQGDDMLFIECSGKAKIITSKLKMAEHWDESLNMWFKDGINTKGIVMVKVEAKTLRYWHKQFEGSLNI